MRFNPGVSWFAPFHELHPSKDRQCIYFTQDGTRCRWPSSNNKRATELHETISSLPAETVGAELLEEYILCWCCISGRARHRDRIEDVELLILLAERWQDEIRRHTAKQFSLAASVVQLGEGALLADAASIPATGNSSRASSVYNTGIASPTQDRPDTAVSSSISITPPTSLASLWSCQAATNTSLAISLQDSTCGPHYNLRSHETNKPTNSISVRPTAPSFRPPLSEFRTHIKEPDRGQCVSQKILDNLVGRDFESGSLYIFDRDSSPGYVKIGWTARSVPRRLKDWSECGYTPNLLFSVDDVPHAQRVETLTHYELIKEWRRERMCKGCEKSHKEWFEVNKERAKQVLGDWVEFMKVAEPYDSEGFLKTRWKDFVLAMKTGETLTAKKLFERYRLSSAERTMPAGKLVSPERAPKLEKQEGGLQIRESTGLPEPTTLKNIHLASLDLPGPQHTFTAPSSFKFEPLPKSETFSKLERFAQAQFSLTPKSSSNIELISEMGTVPGKHFSFKAEAPRKFEPSWKIPPPLEADSLFKAEPFPGIEPLHQNVPARRTPADKELSPEQIPLPASPLLRPAKSQDADIHLSLEMDKLCVKDIITKPNNGSAVPHSSESDALNSEAASLPSRT